MPTATTYPGVYVEEIPSGVRTIAGVATSITAFIGRAARGPVNEAITINNFGDFESRFGGLWIESALGFAVRDFFLNGGGQAIVVRLYHADPGSPNANPAVPAPATKAPLTIGNLKFVAANEGKWGANLRVVIDVDGVSDDVATAMGLAKTDLFNLTVRDTSPGGRTERFLNLTAEDSPRRVNRVLKAESGLLDYEGEPDQAALDTLTKIHDKAKAYAEAVKKLADKLDKDATADVTAEKAAVATGKSELIPVASDALTQKEFVYAEGQRAFIDKQNSGQNADTEKTARDKAKTALDTELDKALKAISNGLPLGVLDFLPANGESEKKGLYAFEQADLFNLLCIPPYRAVTETLDVDVNLISAAASYCEKRRAMLLVDAPKDWGTKEKAKNKFSDASNENVGTRSRNAALFFPRVKQPNPLRDDQVEVFSALGTVAGVYARTDAQRGVWKAPAGLDAALVGVPQLSVALTDAENGELNPLGINCLRSFPVSGRVVWGARTLRGADQLADEYKYVPVRRTALYIEESLYRGLKWVVFEPNDEPLWSQIRLNVGAFLHNLFRQGAFQGSSPRDAYFVKCDKETTTQNDINLGIVNVIVGFAPLKPAEFVIIKLQQMAGQIEV